MRKTIYTFLILLSAIALVACSSAGGSEPTSSDSDTTEETSAAGSKGMMGMGGSMMAAHSATVPDEYAGLSNPIPADDESLERGAGIYATSCASCHGDGGVGDGPASAGLDPAPTNIAHTSQMLGDDYLFWRVSEGGAMEPFNSSMIAWKGILDEQARWDVVNYVQALGSGTVPPRQHVGGATHDSATEAEQRAEMLAHAVEQDVISQEESDTFELVHIAIDDYLVDMGNRDMGGMDDMQTRLLSALLAEGIITQEQADMFSDVHDRLLTAGLMK